MSQGIIKDKEEHKPLADFILFKEFMKSNPNHSMVRELIKFTIDLRDRDPYGESYRIDIGDFYLFRNTGRWLSFQEEWIKLTKSKQGKDPFLDKKEVKSSNIPMDSLMKSITSSYDMLTLMGCIKINLFNNELSYAERSMISNTISSLIGQTNRRCAGLGIDQKLVDNFRRVITKRLRINEKDTLNVLKVSINEEEDLTQSDTSEQIAKAILGEAIRNAYNKGQICYGTNKANVEEKTNLSILLRNNYMKFKF